MAEPSPYPRLAPRDVASEAGIFQASGVDLAQQPRRGRAITIGICGNFQLSLARVFASQTHYPIL
jgi:hypothetical protein